MPSPFLPHGKYVSHVEGRLLVSEVTGPWNRELVDNWGLDCYPLAQALSAEGPYVGIAIIRESMLCPPDAMESLRKVAHLSATRLQCLAHLIVADASVEGRDFLESTFVRLYEGVIAHRMFHTLEQARTWSLALLAEQARKS